MPSDPSSLSQANARRSFTGPRSRRRFLQGLAIASLPWPFLTRASDSKVLNFVSYGGSYGAAVKTHFVTAFEHESGIKVDLGVNSSLAPIKIQVQSNNVKWDLA